MSISLLKQKRYIAAKVLATFSSLVFAFFYSRELGVVNRSILIYAFTLSSLTWVVLTSGTTLTLRKVKPNNENHHFGSFITLILIEALLGIVGLTIGLFLYSSYKTHIPGPLIILIYGYFVLSGLAMVLIEVLITYLKYLISGYIELLAVGIQIILFSYLLNRGNFSIASKLLLSFNISYIIICAWMLGVVASSLKVDFRPITPKLFWGETRGSHFLGISLGVVDRLDRFIIAFYFPTGALARYSAMSSLISYFRFIPEFFSRILISGFTLPHNVLRKHKILLFSILTLAITSVILLSRIFIARFLGQDWLLPISIFAAFGVQELLRGTYQISLNYNSKLNLAVSTSVIPIILMGLAGLLSVISVHLFGLIGIPIAFSATFAVAIFLAFLWRRNV